MYYVYMLQCQNGALYTGSTPDIARRLHEHMSRGSKCAKYTRANPATALAALWQTEDRRGALRLEYAIKRLPRSDKLRLVAEPSLLTRQICPQLSDLSCAPCEIETQKAQ